MSVESLAFLYFCLVGLIKHFVRSSPNTFLISGSTCNSVLIISSISVEVISCVCRFTVATNGPAVGKVALFSSLIVRHFFYRMLGTLFYFLYFLDQFNKFFQT